MRIKRIELICMLVVASVGIFALIHPTDAASIWVGSLAVAFVFTAIPMAIGCTGEKRCFWLSFLLVASVYLSSLDERTFHPYVGTTGYSNSIATDVLVEVLCDLIHPGLTEPVQSENPFDFDDEVQDSDDTPVLADGFPVDFSRDVFASTGHYLFALIVGWLAGQLSVRLRRSETRNAT